MKPLSRNREGRALPYPFAIWLIVAQIVIAGTSTPPVSQAQSVTLRSQVPVLMIPYHHPVVVDFNAFKPKARTLWLDEAEENHKNFLPSVFGPNLNVTNLVSVTPDGRAGNGKSFGADVSGDGRYVGFTSAASDLVPNDTNAAEDVFVRDLLLSITTRVSVSSDGSQGRYESFYPSLSADGRFVAFQSAADNLVPGESYYDWDIFVHDRLTAVTEIVSVSSSGEHGNSDSLFPVISADGRFVAFESRATNLGDNPSGQSSMFVHDRQTKITRRLSAGAAALSGDGRYIAFSSFDANLVPNDTNGVQDVFVLDNLSGSIERVSISSFGTEADRDAFNPSISLDGRFVAFTSRATTLAPDDEEQQDFDMFVRDRMTSVTVRVTVNDDGSDFGPGLLFTNEISGDGRYVVFDWDYEIYVRDWQQNHTEFVSVSSAGEPANPGCTFPAISTEGRLIAFECLADNLVPNDTNDEWDIYAHVRHVP